jgi:hypothetical protein
MAQEMLLGHAFEMLLVVIRTVAVARRGGNERRTAAVNTPDSNLCGCRDEYRIEDKL